MKVKVLNDNRIGKLVSCDDEFVYVSFSSREISKFTYREIKLLVDFN